MSSLKDTIWSFSILILAPLLPARLGIVMGVFSSLYLMWRDKKSVCRQIAMAVWMFWTIQGTYFVFPVHDDYHVSDLTIVAVGGGYYGLGLYRTHEPTVRRVFAFILSAACIAPVRPPKTQMGEIWSCFAFAVVVSSLWWLRVDTKKSTEDAILALSSTWILFVRNEEFYIFAQIAYAVYLWYFIGKRAFRTAVLPVTVKTVPAVQEIKIPRTKLPGKSKSYVRIRETVHLPFDKKIKIDAVDPEVDPTVDVFTIRKD